jgi:hypothetical protein
MRKSARDGCMMAVRRGSCCAVFWSDMDMDHGTEMMLCRGGLQILAPAPAADAENLNLVQLLHHPIRLMDPPGNFNRIHVSYTTAVHVLHSILPYHRDGALVLAEIAQPHD